MQTPEVMGAHHVRRVQGEGDETASPGEGPPTGAARGVFPIPRGLVT